MKFAVISDIHGNLPALDAVIADAEKENVSGFIFAGDYCIGNPWPDECIARISALERKYAVRGNEELYLKNLVGKDPPHMDGWANAGHLLVFPADAPGTLRLCAFAPRGNGPGF